MKKIKITSGERALSIIKSPIMTEKSTNLNQFNKYSFFVSKNSNSQEIKQAIENIFKVKVMKVNTLICLLYTSPSPRDGLLSRMPSSA